MRKPMLEALAACLALAAASGLACAAIQADVKSVSAGASRGNGVSNTADDAGVAVSLFPSSETTVPYSDEKVPANGSIRANAADVALLTSAPTDRSGTRTRLTTGVHAPASNFKVVDALQSNTTFGFSLAGTDDFTLGRRYGTELKRRAIFNQHDVRVLPRGEVVTAGSSQIEAIQTVQHKDSETVLIANAKLAPQATVPVVPEPGRWATVLAGLLGVIAIARRRMSL
jgi:hypothetical protein